ncbi:MAG: energy transducer TonB, partial [Minicystis sp.]
GGTLGGTGTGTVIPPPAPPPTNAVIPFGEGMNRPTLVSGSPPVYSREAREAKVEGTVIASCVITTSGNLQNCRIIKHLEHMDDAVLAALAQQHYTPVTFQGQPVNVQYTLTFRFKLQ